MSTQGQMSRGEAREHSPVPASYIYCHPGERRSSSTPRQQAHFLLRLADSTILLVLFLHV